MGSETAVSNLLREFDEVKEVHGVYGVYDLVVRVEAESMQALKDVIGTKIRRLENIRSTLTMIVIE
jgi:DNA-binding Lrp family transcriptional regulator